MLCRRRLTARRRIGAATPPAGMAVVGVGRDPAKLESLTADLSVLEPGASGRLATVSADVTAAEAPRQIVATALERFGRIDFVVNNAGVGSPKPLDETDDATLDHFLDIMLRAPFRLCREAIPHLRPGPGVAN